MDLGFSAWCIVLRHTTLYKACIAAVPETYEESHCCVWTASYQRWRRARGSGSGGTTQVPMIPWWEYARILTQQNADLKSDLNVQQMLQWWKNIVNVASHILFSHPSGRAKAEKISWTHLDRSPSSHRSACFDPAAATVQQKLSLSSMWEISDAAREFPTLNWVGKDTNSLISSFEDESAGFRISLFFWGWLTLHYFSQISKEEPPCHVLLHSSLVHSNSRVPVVVFVGGFWH